MHMFGSISNGEYMTWLIIYSQCSLIRNRSSLQMEIVVFDD
jgi:hypothetical protein